MNYYPSSLVQIPTYEEGRCGDCDCDCDGSGRLVAAAAVPQLSFSGGEMRLLSAAVLAAAVAAVGLLPSAVTALNHFEGWHPVPASRVADLPYGYVEDDAGVKKKEGGGGATAADRLQERIDIVADDGGSEEDGAQVEEEEEPFFVTQGDNKVVSNLWK